MIVLEREYITLEFQCIFESVYCLHTIILVYKQIHTYKYQSAHTYTRNFLFTLSTFVCSLTTLHTPLRLNICKPSVEWRDFGNQNSDSRSAIIRLSLALSGKRNHHHCQQLYYALKWCQLSANLMQWFVNSKIENIEKWLSYSVRVVKNSREPWK